MPIALCRVSFTDTDRLVHAAQVHAESLYAVVAFPVAAFRGDSFVPPLAPVVTVEKPPVQHRIRLAQVQKWLRVRPG
jgi:hypothetical protein